MDKALVISAGSSTSKKICGYLKAFSFERVDVCKSGIEARRKIGETDYDVVIINCPLPDEVGHDISVMASADGVTSVLLVRSEIADTVAERLEPYGIFVVPKPIGGDFFVTVMRMVFASAARTKRLYGQIEKMRLKYEELRTIDKAKCLLIEYEGVSEQEAHRFIEKSSMDNRTTRFVTAQQIIHNYED